MIDLTAYKASKISKIHLSETNALINKPQTLEKCDDVEDFCKIRRSNSRIIGYYESP